MKASELRTLADALAGAATSPDVRWDNIRNVWVGWRTWNRAAAPTHTMALAAAALYAAADRAEEDDAH